MKARKTAIERWVASKKPCGEIRQPSFEMCVISEGLKDMRFIVIGGCPLEAMLDARSRQ